ncbi:hypothetical protein GQ600_26094 [Phytophthora cactorum]|nr:hypothetical protein GQ600_26094 [Phytophthora cactorum]
MPPQRSPTPRASRSQRARVSLDASPENADQHRLQLIVQGIVKSTVGQRDSSGKQLESFAANGVSFSDIMHKLCEKFSGKVKGQATKIADAWSVERPVESAWSSVMQLKANGRIVPAAKSPELWNRWTASQRGSTATLMIYEYGLGVPNGRILDEFMQACIRPQHTDCSGAAAEVSIREMVSRLQDVWGNTYQASAPTWTMWANEIMRNLDRSTWDAAVLDPPPARLECYLSPSDGQVHEHLVHLTRPTHVALDTINLALADNQGLRNAWEAYGRRFKTQRFALESRKVTLEGYIADIPLPGDCDVMIRFQERRTSKTRSTKSNFRSKYLF